MFALRRIRPLTISAMTSPAARPVAGRWIDPRAQRFGAGASALTLGAAYLFDARPLVALTCLALGISAAAGTRWFLFSRPWPLLRGVLRRGPSELEHEMPPRFAQALGAALLGVAVALMLVAPGGWGWAPVAAVIGLQVLLAVTGFCLGCRLFFLRWWIPDLFARLVGRGLRREELVRVEPPG